VAFAFFSKNALDFFVSLSELGLLKESLLLFDHFEIKAGNELIFVEPTLAFLLLVLLFIWLEIGGR